MRFADLDGLHLRKALRTQTQPWGQALAEADSGPLIAAGEHNGLRVISVAFDLSDSDWPLRVSFPIFLTNAVRWLTAAGGLGASQEETPTGGVASLTLPPGAVQRHRPAPRRQQDRPRRPRDRRHGAGGRHAAGRACTTPRRPAARTYPFAVNLDSRDESALAAQNPPALNHPGTSAAAALSCRCRAAPKTTCGRRWPPSRWACCCWNGLSSTAVY